MDTFELVKKISGMDVKEAFAELKSQAEFFQYSKSEAPFFMQPEGKIYTLYEHDFSFSSGDVINYTAKDGEPAADNGIWGCFIFAEDNWYRYEAGEFILHDASKI